MSAQVAFDPRCRRCPRLSGFLDHVKAKYPAYHCAPVAAFGDPAARLLIVGLAPGMHGANATGRPFTGDFAGILLYRTLHRYGFATKPEVTGRDDGQVLTGCRITNAVKCLPPENKPIGAEINACNDYLGAELAALPTGALILSLGGIAHKATIRALGLRQADYPFVHAAQYALPTGQHLLASYHCSRYNTQTGRLTEMMFDAVIARARALLDAPPPSCVIS
ncbi:uracil-DNA glycosylase [Acidihalobacter ferrooxydans]|uniref:Type-5 uracil-DNA glycosylase n=1 Tax=Acidihalobacter ferrooxydans TaxID=1765967 RepID=A0A1P8UFY8_9GAMM|nr:uracil-DNA glycosylase [Acidihalobacter ferrooxydans]APZ42671.1 SPO1 DNA polymerase [Acidihalobacter ferrooxydans]